jgi:nucleoside-diphosphate-sugar epimerase
MVEAIRRAMFSEGTKGEIINIGNPDEYAILEVARIIKKLCNSDSEIIFKELPKDDPVKRRPDITKAREVINWEPKIKFEEGLKRTIEYFRDLNGNN